MPADNIVDFFVSRRGAAAEIAREVAEVLEASGYRVLVQDFDIPYLAHFRRRHAQTRSSAASTSSCCSARTTTASQFALAEVTNFLAAAARAGNERRLVVLAGRGLRAGGPARRHRVRRSGWRRRRRAPARDHPGGGRGPADVGAARAADFSRRSAGQPRLHRPRRPPRDPARPAHGARHRHAGRGARPRRHRQDRARGRIRPSLRQGLCRRMVGGRGKPDRPDREPCRARRPGRSAPGRDLRAAYRHPDRSRKDR